MSKFIINSILFFASVFLWVLMDGIADKETDITDVLIISFFVVWNINVARKEEK